MRSPFSLCVGIAIVAVSISIIPAFGHHGWGGNLDEEFQISGTVESGVSLAGPHATMKVRSEGQVWDITLAPPPRTQAAGLKEGVIPVGAQVTIQGHRNRDPKRFEIKTERVIWNNRTFNVYPDRK
ncbi:MAG: hypothetical protein DMG14_32150 [Acidobacteria bacterium]|nr:MAG: hypothetical protein DMG14_32150 [Acidobacteriota bacterium]